MDENRLGHFSSLLYNTSHNDADTHHKDTKTKDTKYTVQSLVSPPSGRRHHSSSSPPAPPSSSSTLHMDIHTRPTSTQTKEGDLVQSEYVKSWKLGRVLGKGLCGVVREAESRPGNKIATKIVDVQELHKYFDYAMPYEQLEEAIWQEASIMGMLSHPNIVYLVDCFAVGRTIYIGMEFVEGVSLLKHIPSQGMREPQARMLFQQLCSAVAYCHSKNVIHGDIKPENILLRQADMTIKLIDFGFSHIYTGEKLQVYGGTVIYSPPFDDGISFAWDVWAIAVVLYAMLTNKLPFSKIELLSKRNLTLDLPLDFSDELCDLFVGVLCPNQADRMSMSEVMHTKWFLGDVARPADVTLHPPTQQTPLPPSLPPSTLPSTLPQKDIPTPSPSPSPSIPNETSRDRAEEPSLSVPTPPPSVQSDESDEKSGEAATVMPVIVVTEAGVGVIGEQEKKPMRSPYVFGSDKSSSESQPSFIQVSRTSSSNNHNPLVPSDRAFPLQLFKKKKKKKETKETKERAKSREKEKEKTAEREHSRQAERDHARQVEREHQRQHGADRTKLSSSVHPNYGSKKFLSPLSPIRKKKMENDREREKQLDKREKELDRREKELERRELELVMREKELVRRENLFEMNKRITRMEDSYVTTSSEDGETAESHKSGDGDTTLTHSLASSTCSPSANAKQSKSFFGSKPMEDFKLDEKEEDKLRGSQASSGHGKAKSKGIFRIESSFERDKKKDIYQSPPTSDEKKTKQNTLKSKLMLTLSPKSNTLNNPSSPKSGSTIRSPSSPKTSTTGSTIRSHSAHPAPLSPQNVYKSPQLGRVSPNIVTLPPKGEYVDQEMSPRFRSPLRHSLPHSQSPMRTGKGSRIQQQNDMYPALFESSKTAKGPLGFQDLEEEKKRQKEKKKKKAEDGGEEKKSNRNSKRSPRDLASPPTQGEKGREQVRKLKSAQGAFSPQALVKEDKDRVRKLRSTQQFRSPTTSFGKDGEWPQLHDDIPELSLVKDESKEIARKPPKTVSVPEKSLANPRQAVAADYLDRPTFQQVYETINAASRKSQSFSCSPSKMRLEAGDLDALHHGDVGEEKKSLKFQDQTPPRHTSFSIVVSDQTGMKKDLLQPPAFGTSELSDDSLRTQSYEKLKTFEGFDSSATNLATHGSIIDEGMSTPMDPIEKDRLITSFVVNKTLHGHASDTEKTE